jgi:hypothetical protein
MNAMGLLQNRILLINQRLEKFPNTSINLELTVLKELCLTLIEVIPNSLEDTNIETVDVILDKKAGTVDSLKLYRVVKYIDGKPRYFQNEWGYKTKVHNWTSNIHKAYSWKTEASATKKASNLGDYAFVRVYTYQLENSEDLI